MKINIDYPLLFKKAEKLRKKYSKNSPFPNIVIDNFFNKFTYKNILKAFPNPRSAIWKMPSNSHTVKKKVTKRGKLDLKEYLFSENQKKILRELNSSLFLNFLEKLSGIEGLIPDPYFAEASFACALACFSSRLARLLASAALATAINTSCLRLLIVFVTLLE